MLILIRILLNERLQGLRMSQVVPIFASEATAAKLLDMTHRQFRDLVAAGLLPRGKEFVPGVWRWAVDDLRRIASGDAVDGMGDVKW